MFLIWIYDLWYNEKNFKGNSKKGLSIFMSRREFLEVLRRQLSGQMAQGRAAAHVRYYEDYIQSQVRSGRSESDVLAELGDPRLIAKTLIDTDDSAAVYDESGYSEESYGADDYADNGTESSAGKARSFKLDLSTWYGKAIVIAIAALIVILLTTVLVAVAPFLITFGVVLYLISWYRKKKV